jgi:GAF domain-containing protein/anti-sigma regulatory factor (Ser/Thr protein kinase)
MERPVLGVGEALAVQLRAVHRLTVALHQAETAADFYAEAIETIVGVVGTPRVSLLLFDPDGVMRFKAWRGLSEEYRAAVEGHTPWGPADVDARPLLVPDVEADPDLAALLPVLRAEGIAAAAFVPLICRDQVIGKFMLYYGEPHAFSETEVAMAEILAGHIALAVDRHRAAQELRAAAARFASLQKVTAALSRAVGTNDVAAVALGIALDELGATSGSLCMIDGEDLRIAAASGYSPEVLAHWGRFPLDADLPASEAVRTGNAVFIGNDAERHERYPLFVSAPLVEEEAYAIVPLGEEIPFGALVAGFPTAREFTVEDESYLRALATQCAAALGRAELYEQREHARVAAERARARVAFLAEASAALAASLDYTQTLAHLAKLAVPRLADWCALYLLEDGRATMAGLAHVDPRRAELARSMLSRRPITLDSPLGIGAVLRTGMRQIVGPIDDHLLSVIARDDEHAGELRELDMHTAAILPLVVRGRVIGALFLAVHTGRELDAETVALGEELAARAGAAIDNARLFTARTEAARTLQASLLPPALPVVDGLDLGARYVSGSAGIDVGGDFYDVFPLHGDRHLLVLGDVRGRGVDAANTALLIRHVIRSAAVTLRTPAAILTHVNEVLLRQGSDEVEPSFATAVLAVVCPRADGSVAVDLAVAGHPLPLLRGVGGSVAAVGSAGTALGITEVFTVTDAAMVLRPGETLLCYTDGATERRNGAEFFGEERLATTLAAADGEGDADSVAAVVERAVAGFADDALSDDLALLVVRSGTRAVVPGPAGPAFSGKLMARSMHLAKETASVPAARSFLSAHLAGHCEPDVVDTAILLVSELVTNAVRYGSDPIELDVRCAPSSGTLRITVSDANPAPPLMRAALPDDTGGRGLHLLDMLSESWGHEPHGAGKTVWFTLPVGRPVLGPV